MDVPTLRLSNDDLRHIVEDVDAVEAVAAALVARSGGAARNGSWTVPVAGSLTVGTDGELAEYESAYGGQRCTMPAAGLREYRLAVLTVLATRHLLASGVVTASVIGTGQALELQLVALRTHVPDISHVAVAAIGGPQGGSPHRASPPPDQAVLDLLDRDGIGVSMVTTLADAVFGANLVVLAGPARLNAPRLAKGALLVNTTGIDLPAALLESVHAVYVDDPAGLADSRPFAKAQPARQRGRFRRLPAVAGDLGQVLAGDRPGRTAHDHVLLVELIGGGAELDAIIAGRIHQVAVTAGLGTFARN